MVIQRLVDEMQKSRKTIPRTVKTEPIIVEDEYIDLTKEEEQPSTIKTPPTILTSSTKSSSIRPLIPKSIEFSIPQPEDPPSFDTGLEVVIEEDTVNNTPQEKQSKALQFWTSKRRKVDNDSPQQNNERIHIHY